MVFVGYLIGQNQSLKNQNESIEKIIVEQQITKPQQEKLNEPTNEPQEDENSEEFIVSKLASADTLNEGENTLSETSQSEMQIQSCLYYQYILKGDQPKDSFGEAEECGKKEYKVEYCGTNQTLSINSFISRNDKQTNGPSFNANLEQAWSEKLSDEAECDSTIWQEDGFDVEPPYYSFSAVIQDASNESLPVRKFYLSDDGCCGTDVYMIETKLVQNLNTSRTPTQPQAPKPSSTVTTDESASSNKKNTTAKMCTNYYSARNAWYQANTNTFTGGAGVEAASQQQLQDATERLANSLDPRAGAAFVDMKDFVFHLREIYKAYYPTYDYWTLDGNRSKLIYFSDKIEQDHC